MNRHGWWLAGAGAGAMVLVVGGGAFLVGRVLRPVQAIGATANRISAGNLAERIDVAETDDELGQLATVLNSTFGRLEAAFAQQKQFTADASHELRTPIAVIISEAQATLARERSPAEYREAVQVCLDAAQQMRKLTQSLLALARYDAGQEAIDRVPVDLAECARTCGEFVRALIAERGLRLEQDLRPAPVLGDGDRLHQVVTNLLANAIHYNRPGGAVRIVTGTEHGRSVLRVEDTGIGIASEDLPRIFERFYRADKSRARSEGRHGLGLAICRSIVDAHGGSLSATSEVGAGTTMTLRLPRADGTGNRE